MDGIEFQFKQGNLLIVCQNYTGTFQLNGKEKNSLFSSLKENALLPTTKRIIQLQDLNGSPKRYKEKISAIAPLSFTEIESTPEQLSSQEIPCSLVQHTPEKQSSTIPCTPDALEEPTPEDNMSQETSCSLIEPTPKGDLSQEIPSSLMEEMPEEDQMQSQEIPSTPQEDLSQDNIACSLLETPEEMSQSMVPSPSKNEPTLEEQQDAKDMLCSMDPSLMENEQEKKENVTPVLEPVCTPKEMNKENISSGKKKGKKSSSAQKKKSTPKKSTPKSSKKKTKNVTPVVVSRRRSCNSTPRRRVTTKDDGEDELTQLMHSLSPLKSNLCIYSAGGETPVGRWGHTATSLEDSDRIVVYGGDGNENESTLGDLFVLDLRKEFLKYFIHLNLIFVKIIEMKEWVRPMNCSSISRAWHSAVHVPLTKSLIVFGGERSTEKEDFTKLSDIMVLETDIYLWYPPAVSGNAPCPRSGHSSVLMNGDEVVVFGGNKGRKWYNDIYVLETDTWHWKEIKPIGDGPKERNYHTATVIGDRMVRDVVEEDKSQSNIF